MMEDLLDKLQETNDRHKKLLLDEIVRLKAERDALKARIDKGVRVYIGDNGVIMSKSNSNGTLLFDKDAKL